MSFHLPYDFSEIKGDLPIAALDDNFDTIQAWGQDLEARFTGLFRQVDRLEKENQELRKHLLALDKHFHTTQGAK